MVDAVLVLNAGSSSVKFAVFALQQSVPRSPALLRGQVAGIGDRARFQLQEADGAETSQPLQAGSDFGHGDAVAAILDRVRDQDHDLRWRAVGHRVVHGAERSRPAVIDPPLLAALERLAPWAPQHQLRSLEAVHTLAMAEPELMQVACFDTAFHTSQPPVARLLPLPASLRQRGLQRYGFHGLSYEHVVTSLPQLSQAPLPRRLVIAHLGNGASVCAARDGRSVATSMGFSTLDGLLMGTRCGALDPGVLLYLMREDGLSEAQLSDLLYNRSGLLGISGISSDMRTLLESNAAEAAQAVELFVYSLVRAIGSMAAALGGVDGLVFTGGIGEHAAPIRAAACRDLAWLGVELDAAANAAQERCISATDSKVSVWVVPADEEGVIARHTAALLAAAPSL